MARLIATQIERDQELALRRRLEEQLRQSALHDGLTHLPNRTLLLEQLQQLLDRSLHAATNAYAVFFLDLDRFKAINDSLGHAAGDRLLVDVSNRLLGVVRPTDVVGRLGGDEFVILADLPDVRSALRLADRIQNTISQPYLIDGHNVVTTASIGIAWSASYTTAADVLRDADIAMYRAKTTGKGRAELFDQKMHSQLLARLWLEADLRRAIADNELCLHYQPIVDTLSASITGMEALVRWEHPQRGLIPPGEFIPIAEETGLIVPLGEWVLRTACTQNRAWQMAGLPVVPIAINISARQFKHTNLLTMVTSILNETGLAPHYLELELTESTVMENVDATTATLRSLHEHGIRISLDDFGTGYSSLAYLKRLPLDRIKIDRSFVRDIVTSEDDAAIATAIILLAHKLRLTVVAEGVETDEQRDVLSAHGCDHIQGYLISRPKPVEEIGRWLATVENGQHAMQM